MEDQAEELRELMGNTLSSNQKEENPANSPHKTRIIAVTSGKGGVGKTNMAVNMAIAENGGKTDTSFSNSILKIPFGSVSQVLPVDEQKELTEKICEVLKSVKKQLPDRKKELSKEVNDTIKTPKLDKVLSVLEQVSRIGVNVTESFANIFFLK